MEKLLTLLDVKNDSHWNADGTVNLQAASKLCGEAVTNEAIQAKYAGLNRASLAKAKTEGVVQEVPKVEAATEIKKVKVKPTQPIERDLNREIAEANSLVQAAKSRMNEASDEVARLTRNLDVLVQEQDLQNGGNNGIQAAEKSKNAYLIELAAHGKRVQELKDKGFTPAQIKVLI